MGKTRFYLALFTFFTLSTAVYVGLLYFIGALFDDHTGWGGTPVIVLFTALDLSLFFKWRKAAKNSI
jgi:hypothetical protein